MLSLETYKFIHLAGVIFLFVSLGAYLAISSNKAALSKRLIAITHGTAVVVILVAGFGLLARLGFSGVQSWPLWVWVKLAVWLILAAMILLAQIGRAHV